MRNIITIALATLSTGLAVAGPAQAADKTCGQKISICIYHTPGSREFGLQFRGTAITHFNVRYTRADGRVVQVEVSTGSRNVASATLSDAETGKTRVSVQACNKAKVGPFSVGGSKCTGWLNHSTRVS